MTLCTRPLVIGGTIRGREGNYAGSLPPFYLIETPFVITLIEGRMIKYAANAFAGDGNLLVMRLRTYAKGWVADVHECRAIGWRR